MPVQTDGVLFDILTSDPSTPSEGQMWYNSTDKNLKLYRTSGGTTSVQAKNNVTTVNPTVNDDGTQGYSVGSRWINTLTDEEFVCCNNTTGVADWRSTTSTTAAALTYFQTSAAGDITTTSLTDTPVTSMTLTPGAGTYCVKFYSDVTLSTSGSLYTSIFANDLKVPNTERMYMRSPQPIRCTVVNACIATVAAAQAIDIRWRVSTGTGTMGNRFLFMMKVA